MIRLLAVLAVVCGSFAPAYAAAGDHEKTSLPPALALGAAPAGIEIAERRKADRQEQRQEQSERRAETEQREQQDDDSGPWELRRNGGFRGERLSVPLIMPRMSPDQAAGIARAQNGGGRVLQVQPIDEGYRVKLLKDGEVRVVEVPAQ